MERLKGQMGFVATFVVVVSLLLIFILTVSLGPDLIASFAEGTSDPTIFPRNGLGFIAANLFPIVFILGPLGILAGIFLFARGGG